MRTARLAGMVLLVAFVAGSAAEARRMEASPEDYRRYLERLEPGDTLVLAPGRYTSGLPLRGVQGEPDEPIVIRGPAEGEPAVFEGRRGANTVSLVDVAHVTLRNLTLDGRGLPVDAVKAEATGAFAHHVTLDNLRITGHDYAQGVVGISTKAPAHGWVIRNTVIDGAGTGMYLGDSDGSAPFVGGLIEHNLVVDTAGYNIQIKHQAPRPDGVGLPDEDRQTVIRHNVLSKANDDTGGARARPNLLLGHWPLEGPGRDDRYLVYGNYFYGNPHEALFQAEGNVAAYNNVFHNARGPAVRIQPHNDVPRHVSFLQNTMVSDGTGLRLRGADPDAAQRIAGNAIFAARPMQIGDGETVTLSDNLTGSLGEAAERLRAPVPGETWPDLRPAGLGSFRLSAGAPWADGLPAGECDFDGRRRPGGVAGAYGGTEPGAWQPARARILPADVDAGCPAADDRP